MNILSLKSEYIFFVKSRTFLGLLEEFKKEGFNPEIERRSDLGCVGYYCDKLKRILISEDCDFYSFCGTLIHEMRHAYQDMKGVLRDKNGESEKSNLLLMEADDVAFELIVAYELKDDRPDLWNMYVNYNSFYNGMCQFFEKGIKLYGTNNIAHHIFMAYLDDKGYREKCFQQCLANCKNLNKTDSVQESKQSLAKYFNVGMFIPFQERYFSPLDRSVIFKKLTVG